MFEFLFRQENNKSNHPQLVDNILKKRYQEMVVKHHIQNEAEQIKVLGHFQHLLDDVTKQAAQEKPLIFNQLLFPTKKITKSLYLFGDVGRGKSMLMEVFFKACPIKLKRRVHFHAFMQEVHDYIHEWRQTQTGDPLPSLAIKIRQSALLLCFDEFHVTDIADAMLLARLFTRLFEKGIVFVATSNQHPDDLYKNGLQRELLLPFIDLLKQSADILELVAKEDYRLCYFKSMQTLFYIEIEGESNDFLQQRFDELTNNGGTEVHTLCVKGREVIFSKVHGDILFSSFDELCNRPLGAADYLALANEFNTLLIESIPALSKEISDQARRFVTLVDAVYEKNVKIICTLAVPIEQLYFKDNNFDFKRTQSRLFEMQTDKYLQKKHVMEGVN